MSDTIAMCTVGLSKRFGSVLALDAVDLNVVEGEVFGYLGPNGAGKSTTLRLLTGLLRPTAGSARVLGLDAWSAAPAVHRRIGYVPGELALYDRLTGRQHITFFGHLRGDPVDKAATVFADRLDLDLDLDRTARTMSKGNRQKLALVLALMSGPQLLILDEPTGGLDPLVQHEFHAIIREHTASGGTVLLSSHVLGEVQQVADRVGVLREGRLIAVESLHELRQKSLHHVTAECSTPIQESDFRDVAGIRGLTVAGTSLTCSAPQSALDALIRRISHYGIVDFECAEADLEETFMAFYEIRDRHAA
ncbi:ABC transporter, ATP-binding protein [Rhodococcus jostii RHA1]|uniref:ABC transporter, ATP-binding protein n=1 Tax=Rhodococcus jostii (strain RHA1) TaxID=101510 RepID=Q0SKS0_RHOJR|nr:ABC transporter ATP-binding protein [Rhodococcus jostii]ABG91866.1 ABC transporter, ATP-binding protein [Rhodococcus jostii RHA1]